jgi:hypothetical protein
VAVYFGEQASVPSRTPTRVLPTQTAAPTPPPTPTPNPPKPSKSNIGAIVGGTVGGVAILIIAVCGLLLCLRRRKRNRQTQASLAHPDVTSVMSSMHGHLSDPKYSVVVTSPHSPPSTVHSPNFSTHQADSITQSSPYATPPPVQPEYPYHHPAHGQPAVVYYPPPNASRASAVGRTHSHEMPAVMSPGSHEMPTARSPEATNIAQPRPLRVEVGHE